MTINIVLDFLLCETPDDWVDIALMQQDVLLIDHANCEKKAAATALNLLFRYIDKPDLLLKMSKLAREELRHFEQVCQLMKKRDIIYSYISPSRYASSLSQYIRTYEPEKLVDTLIVGAIIEARSCERFSKLVGRLDAELSSFYQSLLRSESRHFQDYLKLAEDYYAKNIDERVNFFLEQEQELILSQDSEFRFHSGVPVLSNAT